MKFYCPKCGDEKEIESIGILSGAEIKCPDCEVIFELNLRVIYDPEFNELEGK